ncbi:hypothetical protein AL062_11605 [Pseudomonas syringae pv. syringae]|nr:hypothetical protein AL062_11605 [Pseudomonas syringae pv. syringae]KWS26051.1 hypothetical protein AL061_16225 [Pseudomonas syringae pv. syringae]
MSRRIGSIDRVTRTIAIRIDSAVAKRTQAVRAVEAHQNGVVGAITIAQQIMTGQRVRSLTVEAWQRVQRLPMPVGGVGDSGRQAGRYGVEHAVLLVRADQQRGER